MESHLAGDAPSDVPISDGERLIKLALYVKGRAPVDFATIRTALRAEYGAYEGTDKAAAQRFDDKVRRRFERDKKTLQEYGLFFKVDEDSRYSIDDEASFAAPVDLTQEEASLLRLLCGALLDDDNYPLKSELRMILVKIGDELEVRVAEIDSQGRINLVRNDIVYDNNEPVRRPPMGARGGRPPVRRPRSDR